MFEKKKVVFRQHNKWFVGSMTKKDNIRVNKQVSKMTDVEDIDYYVTITKFVKDNKLQVDIEELFERLDIERLYIKTDVSRAKRTDEPMTEQLYWKDKNPTCIKCINPCKQSKYADVVICNRMNIK